MAAQGTPARRGGRRSKFDPETAQKIIDAVRAGNFLETAAEYAGIGKTTLYRWLAEAEEADKTGSRNSRSTEFREFRDALTRARAQNEARMVAVIMRSAAGGALIRKTTRTLRDGSIEVDEHFSGPDGRVALEFLARAFPGRWARRAAIEVTGADGGPIEIATSQQIEELAGRIYAALEGEVVEGEVVDDEDG